MKEFVTANGNIYECTSVTTGIDSITLTMQNQERDEVEELFSSVSELTVSFEKQQRSLSGGIQLEEPHGVYKNLKLQTVAKNVEDGSVIVTMHIKNETEQRLDALEKTEKIQNDVIAELTKTIGGEL